MTTTRTHLRTHLRIHAAPQTVPMGRTVRLDATLETAPGESPRDYLLLPFVNQRRWGSHERPDTAGNARFLLPLPNPGLAHIQVLAVKSDTDDWMGLSDPALLLAGHPMPDVGICSEVVDVQVMWRTFPPRAFPAREPSETLFGMQWEPWFNSGAPRWHTAQSVPIMGFYDSYNRDVTRQHILWFMDLGIDFILPDWTNHLWGCQHWDERPDYTNAIIHATTLALETLADMRDEGLPVPQVALFPGLSNGRPSTVQALNEEFAWIYHTYVRNPRFAGLWQDFDGKPLIVALDTGAVGHPHGTAESAIRVPFFKQTLELSAAELDAFRTTQPPVDDSTFTVRWMSSQNETTCHHELGFWSWMDGTLEPPVTYKDGVAEAVTVTPSFFNTLGWTAASARGRLGGSTYLETFKVALQHRPRVVFLHQFNEFTGQAEGHGMGPNHDIYVDTYNVEFSDDIEPVSLAAPGYRGDQGGWGFYYLNLTQALMALYRGNADDCTLLAVSSPARNAVVPGPTLHVAWSVIGKPASGYSIAIDGQPVMEHISANSADIPLAGLGEGQHTLTVTAEGAVTRYPLSWLELDTPLAQPIATRVDVPFACACRAG